MSSPVENWKVLLTSARVHVQSELASGASSVYDPLQKEQGSFIPSLGTSDPLSQVPPSFAHDVIVTSYLEAARQIESLAPAEVTEIILERIYQRIREVDPSFSGRGVLQFVTTLHFLHSRDISVQRDPSEVVSPVLEFYEDFRVKMAHAERREEEGSAKKEMLGKMMRLVSVLYEIVMAAEQKQAGTVTDKKLFRAMENTAKQVESLNQLRFNIVDVDSSEPTQAFEMKEKISSVLALLNDTSFLPPFSASAVKRAFDDKLKFLQYVFGFQEDNIRNQKENILLLLANLNVPSYSNFLSTSVDLLFDKTFSNFLLWANYLHVPHDYLKLRKEDTHLRLLMLCLFHLIWGEAANVRFLPECLCFIFHKMADELFKMLEFKQIEPSIIVRSPKASSAFPSVTSTAPTPHLSSSAATPSSSTPSPSLSPPPFLFLEQVIMPFYKVIAEEDKYAEKGAAHQNWRNYDDLNEFFWSSRCLSLEWPINTSHKFFLTPTKEKNRFKRLGKTLFVEWRNFWHVFHSFHRLWIFLLLMLQALMILAFGGSSDSSTFFKMLSIFPAMSALQLLQAALDLFQSFNAYGSLTFSSISRKFLRLGVLGACSVALTYLFINMITDPTLPRFQGTNAHSLSHLFFACIALYSLPPLILNILQRFSLLRRGTDTISHFRVAQFFKWFVQEEVFVGRGMYERTRSYLSYSCFWVVLLTCKFLFSFYYQITPLVNSTRYIINSKTIDYAWHDLISAKHYNAMALVSVWAPVVTIYLLDVQVWYTVMSAIGGGLIGAWWRLGEIRTLDMLRMRFQSFPKALYERMVPLYNQQQFQNLKGATKRTTSFKKEKYTALPSAETPMSATTAVSGATPFQRANAFAAIWNEIISLLREEDLINNKEKSSLLMPLNNSQAVSTEVQWPLFLLSNKLSLAVSEACIHVGGMHSLWASLSSDFFTRVAVMESYFSLKWIFTKLFERDTGGAGGERENLHVERAIVKTIFQSIEYEILNGSFLVTFDPKSLSSIHQKLCSFIAIMSSGSKDKKSESKAVHALQTLFDAFKNEMVANDGLRNEVSSLVPGGYRPFSALKLESLGPVETERLQRFHLLLSCRETLKDVPKNLEAQRRLLFFCNSLFMKMPNAPPIQNAMSFCVMTPYYSETVAYSLSELIEENEDGISTLFYLKKIYPDEWLNFLERASLSENALEETIVQSDEGEGESESSEEDKKRTEELKKKLRSWASFRGQTLARTVRGMMYYHRALRLLGAAEQESLLAEQTNSDPSTLDVEAGSSSSSVLRRSDLSLYIPSYLENKEMKDLADLKFTYVVSCQIFGKQKQLNDPRAAEIYELMKSHEALRIAYVDEQIVGSEKEFYSCLVRVDRFGNMQNIYRVKLPGNAKLGEGKPSNQNHAIIFSRGEALQTIDMNQDHYFEETLKMRNLLEEFNDKSEMRRPTILGLREHIFTGSVSSLAWFMSNQETSFVTLGQRFLAYPLKVRMHYGHPDVFDRLFHITRGGISKCSRGINISEDIYAGFNTTLRQGNVTHHEYIQCGKGRDVGLNQIAAFEAKVAGGNGEQMLSRDVYRLGDGLDFPRMLSFFYTSVGFYICTTLTAWCAFFFLYGKVYMALSGVESSIEARAELMGNAALFSALNSQFLIQIGLFSAVPMIMGFILEEGMLKAILYFVTMQLQLASVFFTFSLGTRSHHFSQSILHGGAKYQATGRGFVVRHIKFAENYRQFAKSHFYYGFEIVMLLLVYMAYGYSPSSLFFLLLSLSSWFLACSLLFAPFFFNPSGFEWQKLVSDFEEWSQWIFSGGGIGMKAEQSWEAWWEERTSNLSSLRSRAFVILLNLRFFLFQYGVVYHLNVAKGDSGIMVYALSWIVFASLLIYFWLFNLGRSLEAQILVRLLKAVFSLAFLLTLLCFLLFTRLTLYDVWACTLAFVPTLWGMLQVSLAFRPSTWSQRSWVLQQMKSVAKAFDVAFGICLLAPIAVLSWFPFISTFQTRLLFNQAFSRGLEISLILAGQQHKGAVGSKSKVKSD